MNFKKTPAFLALTLLGAACSSTTISTTTSPSEPADAGASTAKDPTDDSKKTTPDGGDSTGSVTGSSNPDDKCLAGASQKACQACCAQAHESGYQLFMTNLLGCACAAPGDGGQGGPCLTACTDTMCNSSPSEPDKACDMCLGNATDQGGGCTQVWQKCGTDDDCVAVQHCMEGCAKMN